MSALYYARVERRDFGDLLSADGLSRQKTMDVAGYEGLPQVDGKAVLALWSRDPKEMTQLPCLLVCPDGSDGDWAAWITTFAARIRPFSAYMRLVSEADLQYLAEETRAPTLGGIEWPISGLILGEVLGASRLPDKALETLSATACASTLSFVMFRAAAQYSDFQQWSYLVDSWESVRQVTKQRPRSVDSASVARICATIMDAAGLRGVEKLLGRSDRVLRDVCRELITSPERIPSKLSEFPNIVDIEGMMHGQRENRVLAFEDFVNRIDARPTQDAEFMSFLLGYLASRIAPGTIRHATVLGPVTQRYPTATLWYGFCAGLGDTETTPASGRRSVDLPASARRILRDLLRPESLFDAPRCDIGFLELSALSRTGGDTLEGLITTTQGTVTVELMPGVWTAVSVSMKPPTEPSGRTPHERETLATIGKHIEHLHEAYNELIHGEPPTKAPEQRSLFATRRKKK